MNCPHRPPCPAADRPDREAARLVATHPEQGWNLLCNGVVTFDDTGDLLPDGRVVAPHRTPPTGPRTAPATGTPRWITSVTARVAKVAGFAGKSAALKCSVIEGDH